MFLLTLVDIAAQIYQYMMIAYVLLSFFPNARDSAAGELLSRFVEPFFAPFRRFIPPIGGMIDISPIFAFLAFHYAVIGLKSALVWLLF
jgi:YggT family protein